jgi:hypothetical protein
MAEDRHIIRQWFSDLKVNFYKENVRSDQNTKSTSNRQFEENGKVLR